MQLDLRKACEHGSVLQQKISTNGDGMNARDVGSLNTNPKNSRSDSAIQSSCIPVQIELLIKSAYRHWSDDSCLYLLSGC